MDTQIFSILDQEDQRCPLQFVTLSRNVIKMIETGTHEIVPVVQDNIMVALSFVKKDLSQFNK